MLMLWRNWVAFVAVLAVVLTTLGVLSALQHDAILSRLTQQRLAVIAETTASPFRSVIGLGLPIATVRNAKQVLHAAKEIDPSVVSIQVFHPTGIVVHTTAEDNGPPIGKDILLTQSLSTDDRWSATGDGELLAGLTLRNPNGSAIGGILVSSKSSDVEANSAAVVRRIAFTTIGVFVAFSVLALFMLRLRLAGVMRGLAKLQRLSDDFSDERQYHAETPAPSVADARYGFFTDAIVELERQLNDAFAHFRAARRRLSEVAGRDTPDPGTTNTGPEPPRLVTGSVSETTLSRAFARKLTPWAAAIILGSVLSLGYFVQRDVTQSFAPELAARTQLIGAVANANVQRAVNAGVPLTSLTGAESYFAGLLDHFPEVSYFGVATGKIVYEAGKRQETLFAPAQSRKDVPTFPITSGGEQIGYIIIDANSEFFVGEFREMLLDFAVVVLVVMLLAFQIMTVVISRSLTAPFIRLQYLAGLQAAGDFSTVIVAKGVTAIDRLTGKLSQHAAELHRGFAAAVTRQSADHQPAGLGRLEAQHGLRRGRPDQVRFSYLSDVRLPLFLFAAADELPLAFFPLFTAAADNPLTWLDPGVVISLPLAGYLVAIVFGSPLARPLAERFGHRRLLLFAAVPTLLAHLGLYLSTDVIEIVLFRTITGLGYAIATLTCQDYVLDAVPRKDRNRSLGSFTAAMYSGLFAGTALGGVLADRLGQSTVFAVSAGLVLVSGILTHRLLPPRLSANTAVISAPVEPRRYLPPIWRPLHSLRFAALVFGVAIPANILMQAFISFLVALQLNAIGASAADIGRILMTYFLAIALVGPVAPRLFEHRISPTYVGLLGAVLSGISLSVVVVWPAQWSMLFAVAGAGIAHGMVRDPQVAVAMDIAERELAHLGSTTVLGSLRTLERTGSIIGLVAIAILASFVGYVNAIAAIAGLVFAGAAGFALASAASYLSPRSRRIAESPPADTG